MLKNWLFKTLRRAYSDRGIGLLELVLVVPFLLMLFLSGVEFSRSMRTYSQLTTLSRELAKTAYRTCSLKADSAIVFGNVATIRQPVQDCLVRVLQGATDGFGQGTSNNIGQGLDPAKIRVAVTLYKSERVAGGGAIFQQPAQVALAHYPSNYDPLTDNNYPTRINVGQFNFTGSPSAEQRLRKQLLIDQNVLVYAEIFYQYSPIVPPIAGIFDYNGGVFYVPTVF